MKPEEIADSLNTDERNILPLLKNHKLLSELNLDHIRAMRALQFLQNKKLVSLKKTEKTKVILDKNGEKYIKTNLPETNLINLLKKNKTLELNKIKELNKDELFAAIGILKKKNLIKLEKGELTLLKEQTFPEENFLKNLPLEINKITDKTTYNELKKRKNIIKTETEKDVEITLTPLGKNLIAKKLISKNLIEAVTPNLIKSGKYKKFRKYDVKINVPKINRGRRHFTHQAIDYIKQIWLDMGFQEMKGNLIQTSFWDLDSLFVPQDHPARNMQDTFYIQKPKYGKLPKNLAKKIKATHENGWTTGSNGWGGIWSETKAKENMLRTHTTVLSAQAIHKLKKSQLPAKFFSVNKVFRNETLDWKHLFEFYQVEGIVVDPNANLRNLQGYLKEFYLKMGYKDVRMRPAHFPYTEPSMEVDVLHPVKKEWIELGGSGIFRPEVVKPLLGIDCPVLAWGQGMERIIVEYFKINDLREIYKNDIKQLRTMKEWMK